MRRFITLGPAAVVLLTALAALLAAPEIVRRTEAEQAIAQVQLARQELVQDDILLRINRANRAIARSVEPGVVHLMAASRYRAGAAGSGWVYDDDGHILTNAHVVGGADRVSVQLYTGRVMTADVVGVDVFTDIAVLKAEDATGMIALPRATDEMPQQGDRVFAFGSPFNFKFSMSEGIVSGLGRDPNTGAAGSAFTNFIQTDAAVNPGNSGGPLIDVRGRVIGMNVAIATGRSGDSLANPSEGQSAGISFAIPLPTIESVADQLIETGHVARGRLGIAFGGFGRSRAIVDGDDFVGMGVLVGQVTDGGPAERAGILANDIIESIGGQAVPNSQILRAVVNTMRPGKALDVRVWRRGEPIETTVVLDELDALNAIGGPTEQILDDYLGLDIMVDNGGRVYVQRTKDDSLAKRAGLQPGQQIMAVGGVTVDSYEDFLNAIGRSRVSLGRTTTFLVQPRGDEDTREITIHRRR
ncbi:MAG: trypsin-like peptidase domain-containing protein [Phycisphaera sp.]|nr:MAG: trypsin-like peptidase domain-containing protein [Phycisphaera sp.]